MSIFDSLWVEKYRPDTLQDIVLPVDVRECFEQYKTTQQIPNILFVGNAGIGKTSLAKIIVKDILPETQHLYINASDENGIDTIRTAVTSFAKTRSLTGSIKVVILDEVDGLTMDAQRALRNTIEEYSSNTRFILTANYKHRVITPLQSRAQYFDLTPDLKDCVSRIVHILKQECIKVSIDQKKLLPGFIKSNYPDLRKIINELQKRCIDNTLRLKNVQADNDFIQNIFSHIRRDSLQARKYVIENEMIFNRDYPGLLKQMFQYIIDSQDNLNNKQQLVIISEHLYKSAFVLDQEINFSSCCISLENSSQDM